MGAYNGPADMGSIFRDMWQRLAAMERTQQIPQYATAALPVASTVEGLQVYDTTSKTMKFSNGTTWVAM